MKISTHTRISALVALALLASSWALTGCEQRSLFAEDDRINEGRLKPFGDESAVKTAQSRQQASQWGFGFPTNPGE
jgi:hypothetical protein